MKKEKKQQETDLHTWERPFRADGLQERNPAFECFLKYRDMGANRSLMKLAKQENIEYQKMCNWSSNYQWNKRIKLMLEHECEENKRLNAKIKKQAFDMAVKRQEIKSDLIETIFKVLKKNAEQYLESDVEVDFDKFVTYVNIAMKLENMNLDDMMQIEKVEQLFMDSGMDAGNIQALINNYNVVLTSENNDAIDKYEDVLKDDNY